MNTTEIYVLRVASIQHSYTIRRRATLAASSFKFYVSINVIFIVYTIKDKLHCSFKCNATSRRASTPIGGDIKLSFVDTIVSIAKSSVKTKSVSKCSPIQRTSSKRETQNSGEKFIPNIPSTTPYNFQFHENIFMGYNTGTGTETNYKQTKDSL